LEAIPDTDSDLLQALVGLGYSLNEAQKAVAAIPHDAPLDLEDRLRIALQYFTRRMAYVRMYGLRLC
jgi:Holliday junction DNA helicase RuvA